jgi:Anti-sigma-K factor rskA/Putative zinc-finger
VRAEPSHGELQELLGAYALDAVPEDERRDLEAHLAECPRCRAEVAEHRDTAALLAGGAPAPDGLWDRIAAALDEPPPALELERVLEGRRRARPPRWVQAVAAAAAVVAIWALGLQVIQQDRRLDQLAAGVQQAGLVRAANAALLDPDARRVAIVSEDRAVTVDAVVLPDGAGYVVRDTLGRLPPDRTYQLWALGRGDPISAGVLGNDPGIVAFAVDPDIQGLAISEEVSGGATAPSAVVAQGEVESA